MKKAILVLLTATILFSLVACASDKSTEEHTFVSHEAKQATCDEDGNDAYYTCSDCDKIFDANKQVISAIPVISALGHNYELQSGKDATCVEGGVIEHYSCDVCDKVFDLDKNEITDVATVVDSYNHASSATIVADTTNVKTTYKAGENFDATGLVVTCKCESCEGYVVDNQALTYVYQDENATAFALNDTKVTVVFNEMAFDVTVTVTKNQAVISGVEETYVTSCGVAPVIEATANNQELDIVIEYYDAENQEVEATNFVEGATYTAKIYIEETDEYLGAEVTSTVTVAHKYEWKESAEDWKKVNHICNCGETKDYYVMNYQSPYVDADNLGIDLFAFVYGTENVTVKEIKQVVRVKDGSYLNAIDGEVVDIDYTNEGVVYSFSADKYEQPTEYKPYILTLLVTYEVEGAEFNAYVEAKLIDKLIKTAEDLKLLAYIGASSAGEEGAYEDTKYYALANDVNAENVEFNSSKPAWNDTIGFRGTLDGNGYTISNLKITDGQGLFGALGYGAKIQNVNFTNVYVPAGNYALAFACRNTYMTNVNFEFNVDSPSKCLFLSANNLENEDGTYKFNNVTIKTCIDEGNPFLVDENAENAIPNTVVLSYYDYYVVNFDTDGAGENDSAYVTAGRKISAPTAPVKTSDDYDYEFLGWYNGETKFDFNTPISEGITLVAKWNQTEKKKAEDVVNIISALPESVTMPADVNYVPNILNAKSAYGELGADEQEKVTNYSKLETLLSKISGYSTVYTPSEGGIKAIPAALHNPNPEVGVAGAFSTDEKHGKIFVSTAEENGKAAIQFLNFPSVSDYQKIYFYVRTNKGDKLYFANDAGEDGWGSAWINNSGNISDYPIVANEWSLISIDTSVGIFSTDWVISVWASEIVNSSLEIGSIVGYNANAVVEEKIEVSLDFGVRVDTGATNEYGKIYNVSREQYYIDNGIINTIGTIGSNKLVNALPEGYEYFEFWLYNPTDVDQTFHIAGGDSWVDSPNYITLTARSWSKVVITKEDIDLNKASGNMYVYLYNGTASTGGSANAEGWQISTIYAVKNVAKA